MERCIVLQRPRIKTLKIMLLGEAPGSEEEKQGIPFVGQSGKLLDILLERAELPRTGCVVTNVFHVRPVANEIARFFTGDEAEADEVLKPYKYKGGYLRKEYGKEIQRLMRELKTYKPRVVVAMGATALWAMTGRTDISKCVGQPLTVQSHIVLPMYHPSFLLRSHNDFYNQQAVEVLLQAKEFCGLI